MTLKQFEADTFAEYELELEKDGSLEWATFFDNALENYNDVQGDLHEQN